MSSYSPAVGILPAASARAGRLVLPMFTAALFLSALLLFGVQPMFTKMVLPVLGGTPAVWSVAMVVFQALLLAGYLYAHGLTRMVGLRAAATVHLTVLAGAFLAMPIAVASGWGRPPASGEALWLIGLFTASVGLPFFALAGNGPLLQAWFARSGHGQAKDPYFLTRPRTSAPLRHWSPTRSSSSPSCRCRSRAAGGWPGSAALRPSSRDARSWSTAGPRANRRSRQSPPHRHGGDASPGSACRSFPPACSSR